MTYEEWEAGVPQSFKQDVIWRVQAYRLAHYLAACAELDTRALIPDPRFREHIDQLCRATGGVGANIADGYPRHSGKDRKKYYRYALTSLAEAKSWYLNIRTSMDGRVLDDRFALIRSIVRLLNTMIRRSSDY